ncbi:hypothetical protein [Vibrio spartinae]|uniref:Uncharacterized protein n=1 Tax=Vibrio spartinae TaxID=1918945 RepID=A0A1N6MAR1_9VIBR|nr:hypothetical protein [Vibrio spartinae]SIO96539.1 hypothetical protein VSP9026_04342 [Vibrio spartinae]
MSINQDAETNDIHMLKNIDYLGRGYNILTIDPYTFSSEGASKHYVFDIDAFDNIKPIPDGTALIASVGENTLLQINNGGSNNLYYLVGKVIDGRLTWVGTKGIKFDTGDRPALAIMPNGNTVEMHNGGGNNNLYYHLGKLE